MHDNVVTAFGIAAQFRSTKGPAARGPVSWIVRASSPLPVPVSPCRRMGGTRRPSPRVGSKRVTLARISRTGALSPKNRQPRFAIAW